MLEYKIWSDFKNCFFNVIRTSSSIFSALLRFESDTFVFSAHPSADPEADQKDFEGGGDIGQSGNNQGVFAYLPGRRISGTPNLQWGGRVDATPPYPRLCINKPTVNLYQLTRFWRVPRSPSSTLTEVDELWPVLKSRKSIPPTRL